MKLSRLFAAAGIPCRLPDREITGVTSDSRCVYEGFIFVAVRGAQTDGGRFAADAVRRGAAVIVAETEPEGLQVGDTEVSVVIVSSAREAIARLCSAWYFADAVERGGRRPRIIAVTGTNGKTTVTHMITAILSAAGYKTGLIGTVGCFLGGERIVAPDGMTTPAPENFYRIMYEMYCGGAEFIVFEASSHGIAQGRLAGLPLVGPLEAAVFTNLTPEHLDYHRDMEDYFHVKARLFTEFSPAVSVVNVDDQYGERIAAMCTGRLITTGVRDDTIAEWKAVEREFYGTGGVGYLLSSPDLTLRVFCPTPGGFTYINTLEALACAIAVGVDPAVAQEAIRVFYGVKGRIERVKTDATKFSGDVFIDYAHTPAALEGLLRTVRAFTDTRHRIVLLFGCGGDRDKAKRPLMGEIASRLSDYVIITSDNRRGEAAWRIIADIMSGYNVNTPHIIISDRGTAIRYAIMEAKDGDVILLAGKGHETYEDAGGIKRPFDEREVVFAAVNDRYRIMNGR